MTRGPVRPMRGLWNGLEIRDKRDCGFLSGLMISKSWRWSVAEFIHAIRCNMLFLDSCGSFGRPAWVPGTFALRSLVLRPEDDEVRRPAPIAGVDGLPGYLDLNLFKVAGDGFAGMPQPFIPSSSGRSTSDSDGRRFRGPRPRTFNRQSEANSAAMSVRL